MSAGCKEVIIYPIKRKEQRIRITYCSFEIKHCTVEEEEKDNDEKEDNDCEENDEEENDTEDDTNGDHDDHDDMEEGEKKKKGNRC